MAQTFSIIFVKDKEYCQGVIKLVWNVIIATKERLPETLFYYGIKTSINAFRSFFLGQDFCFHTCFLCLFLMPITNNSHTVPEECYEIMVNETVGHCIEKHCCFYWCVFPVYLRFSRK